MNWQTIDPASAAHAAYVDDLERTYDDPHLTDDQRQERAIKSALSTLQWAYVELSQPWIEQLSIIEARRPIVITRFLDGSLAMPRSCDLPDIEG